VLHGRCPYTLQCAALPLKIAPSHEGSGPPCNTQVLRPTRGISISSAFFCTAHYCDSPTDGPCSSVCNNRLHLASVTMQPNNNNTTTSNVYTTTVLQTFFPGSPRWAGARRELLDFMVQGNLNRGRHTDHPAGRHSIQTNQCPPPPSPHIFYRPDVFPAAQPTALKHWRQLAHSD